MYIILEDFIHELIKQLVPIILVVFVIPVLLKIRTAVTTYIEKNVNSEILHCAKQIWNIVEEDFRLNEKAKKELHSKADMFDEMLIKKFPYLTKEDLNYYENYYIYYYDSLNHGYNRSFGRHSVGVLMGEKHPQAKYTDEEILNIRKEYVHCTMLELYDKYQKNQSFYSFKNTISNSYKHLPVYKKSKKEWYWKQKI